MTHRAAVENTRNDPLYFKKRIGRTGSQMQITVEYLGQLRHLAQTESECREYDSGSSIPDVLSSIAKNHDAVFQSILFDASGSLLSTALILMGDEPVSRDPWPQLSDGDVITLLPPIAGG